MNQLSYLAIHAKSEKISTLPTSKKSGPDHSSDVAPFPSAAQIEAVPPGPHRPGPGDKSRETNTWHYDAFSDASIEMWSYDAHGERSWNHLKSKIQSFCVCERSLVKPLNKKGVMFSYHDPGLCWASWHLRIHPDGSWLQESSPRPVRMDLFSSLRQTEPHPAAWLSKNMCCTDFWLESKRVQTLRACSCSQKMAPVVPKVVFSYSNSIEIYIFCI